MSLHAPSWASSRLALDTLRSAPGDAFIQQEQQQLCPRVVVMQAAGRQRTQQQQQLYQRARPPHALQLTRTHATHASDNENARELSTARPPWTSGIIRNPASSRDPPAADGAAGAARGSSQRADQSRNPGRQASRQAGRGWRAPARSLARPSSIPPR
ncbi:uncharacterized protein LOC62_06G007893 [Vanrija pseudolonga]|uniref:Uncharacterized protein n=1 Tax=Vanrija pseudolonga TaxID=143232 RepID=A0AAF0YI40_9TREE|nr:hypothetical protein LOC62_06G007893 [Vanrija pseudolonga]